MRQIQQTNIAANIFGQITVSSDSLDKTDYYFLLTVVGRLLNAQKIISEIVISMMSGFCLEHLRNDGNSMA